MQGSFDYTIHDETVNGFTQDDDFLKITVFSMLIVRGVD